MRESKIWLERNMQIDPSALSFEIAERKGLGHPDSLVDTVTTSLSIKYSRYSQKKFGIIHHHNFDKTTLCAGAADWEWGGGQIIDPIIIDFVGRGILEVENHRIPFQELAEEQCKKVFLRNVGPDLKFEVTTNKVKAGVPALRSDLSKDKKLTPPSANDTSFATAWYPLTKLEKSVLKIEKFLTGKFRTNHPFMGTDVKVMGRRKGGEMFFNIAAAFISKYIDSVQEYHNTKQFTIEEISSAFDIQPEQLLLNSADDPTNEKCLYITVSGTSAEYGDDGQVGRGNRGTGVIAPLRPQTLEAIAGKNPNRHVGNFYNIWASRIAQEIFEECQNPNSVILCSKIGKPITDCDVFLLIDKNNEIKERRINEIVKSVIDSHESILKDILVNKVEIYPYNLIPK